MYVANDVGAPIRVLVLHNRYKVWGGEEAVFEREVELLRSRGHAVETYEVDNHETDHWSKLGQVVRPIWNQAQYDAVKRVLQGFRADIVHIHNLYAVLSPAVYYAARASGAAIVQTLHNFRLSCVNALLWKDGRPCEACVGRSIAWPGVAHGCYRGSRGASLSVAAVTTVHQLLGTWRSAVDAYIVMTEMARSVLVRSGLPPDRIIVKPHFTAEPPSPAAPISRSGALYVGRLSPEKGIDVLLQAWHRSTVPLQIVGDGPLMPTLPQDNPSISILGRRSAGEVAAAMREASVLVMPSIWYETFGMVIIEAFACGLPVIASRLGAMAELVEEGKTGLLFTPGDAEDLAAKVQMAFERPDLLARMGANAYASYRDRYTPERGYVDLLAIYRQAMARRARARAS